MATGPATLSCFAVTAPGLEPLTAAELSALGLLPANTPATPGGVAFETDRRGLFRANLHLRTASRVLVRLGEFRAVGFDELRKKAARLAWDSYLKPGKPISLHVTCRKSRLYHSDAVAERVAAAIGERLGQPVETVKASESDETSAHPLVVVRLLNDQVTVSVDSSGDLLHRRGYRLATAKAPLRETLAAAMLLASGWDTTSPLLDPFCGSGTIVIEAARMVLSIPPGGRRRFAFMDWPGFNTQLWQTVLNEARPHLDAPVPIIQASDRDAGAIELARQNAGRAGVADKIEFAHHALSDINPPDGPGWIVTNPPYGLRVSPTQDLRNLYAQIGNVLRRSCPGWQVAILSSDVRLLQHTGLALDTSFSMINGGVNVRLGRGEVPV